MWVAIVSYTRVFLLLHHALKIHAAVAASFTHTQTHTHTHNLHRESGTSLVPPAKDPPANKMKSGFFSDELIGIQ